jgi:glyoxylate/hydroxypyruvate reductase
VTLLIAVTWDPQPWVERFKKHLPKHDIAVLGHGDFDRSRIRYVATWGPKPRSLSDLPALEAIFSLGAGVDHLMGYQGLPDVPIVRVAQDDLTHRMSEYVVLHCLMHLRDQRRFDAAQRAKQWDQERSPPIASEVRVGVMGSGVLGQDAARKLKVMGFDVAAWSRSPKNGDGYRIYSSDDGLAEFLARTDILVSLLPLTPETRGILDRRLFAALPRGAGLVNVDRGPHLVDADLLAALEEGQVSAALLDVTEPEPLPPEHPFWHHPRVWITPHIASQTQPGTAVEAVVANLRRHARGEPLVGVVDRGRGY